MGLNKQDANASDSKELEVWKTRLEEMRDKKNKLEGKLEQALEALAKAGFNGVEEALKEQERLLSELEKWKAEKDLKIKEWTEKYAPYITEISTEIGDS